MAGKQKLPDHAILRQHVADGMSRAQIAALYGVTSEGVRRALIKYGIEANDPPRRTHKEYLPWRVQANHQAKVEARRLRAYSKRMQGLHLESDEERLLNQWLRMIEGDNPTGQRLSVAYDRESGFRLVPREPQDRDFVRRPSPLAGHSDTNTGNGSLPSPPFRSGLSDFGSRLQSDPLGVADQVRSFALIVADKIANRRIATIERDDVIAAVVGLCRAASA